MGNGSEQIGPKLLVFGQHRRGFFFLQILLVFQGQRTFSQDREENTALKGIQRLVRRRDADSSVYPVPCSDRQIGAGRIRKGLRSRTGPLVVCNHPARYFLLLFGGIAVCWHHIIHKKQLRFHLSFRICAIRNDVPLKYF